MIIRFRHKGLRHLYETGDRRRGSPDHADKLTRILARLDVATGPNNMDLPGFRLHPLKGDRAGYWDVTVSRNHRVVLRFGGEDATDIDFIDYHAHDRPAPSRTIGTVRLPGTTGTDRHRGCEESRSQPQTVVRHRQRTVRDLAGHGDPSG